MLLHLLHTFLYTKAFLCNFWQQVQFVEQVLSLPYQVPMAYERPVVVYAACSIFWLVFRALLFLQSFKDLS